MAKIVITMEGGIIQSIHSNKPIHYIIVDEDLDENERISDVYQEDSLFPEFFDVLDSETNNIILSKLSNIEDNSNNVHPEITLEQAIKVMIDNGYIRHFWHIDDIIQQADTEDIELTDEQINDVVSKLEDTDCNIGVNWDSISVAINSVVNNKEEEED
jgi:hypothetical protein